MAERPVAEISGYMTMLALTSLQQVTTKQYDQILKAAGMERFINNMPPPTLDLVSSSAEWAQLQHHIYKMLGENLYRLFGRNLGTKMGEGIIQTPWAAETKARLQQIPPATRMDTLLTDYIKWANGQGIAYKRTAVPDGYGVILPQPCTLCQGITGAGGPICSVYPIAIRIIASHLYGQRVQAVEYQCQAVGDPICVVRITV
jgi:predicted hydrocarbon binding protein